MSIQPERIDTRFDDPGCACLVGESETDLRSQDLPRGKECMEYLIGVGLAALVCIFAIFSGFDRDRVFYPTLVIVVATSYVLFAVVGSSMPALGWECLIASVFLAMAVAGFKKNLWLIVAALAGHGIFDFFHHRFIQNPAVPEWWPGFCLSFDVLAGGFLALLLMRRSVFASTARNQATSKSAN